MRPGDKDSKDMEMLRKAAQLRAVSGRSKVDNARKKVDLTDKPPEAAEPEKAPAKTYTVQAGDTLSGIALKLLGNANRWHDIFNANKDKIKNPDLIQIGQELVIPD